MIDRLKPYPKYKDSGVPWLGKVPEHWEVRKLRHILHQRTERNQPQLPLLSVVREKGVILRDVDNRNTNYNYIPDDLSNYKVVRSGQFVMNKMKAWQGSYGVSRFNGIVSPAYFVFDLAKVDGQYFHLAIRSKAYIPFFNQASDGVRIGQWDLSQPRMREIPFFIPPFPEQTAIVRFLDWAERRIQSVIRARRRRIKLLEEYKQALINQIVTGKINVSTGKPYPKYKDSGVEWLDKVPEHWEMRRLKTFAKIRYGLGQPPREASNGGLPFIRATNIQRGKILDQGMLRVEANDVPVGREAFLTTGEIIVVRSGAYTADSAIITPDYEGAVAGYDMVVTVKLGKPQFVAYAILSPYVLDDQLTVVSMRSAQPHLNAEELGAARILLPPLPEQTAIVEFLNERTAKIDAAISATHPEIDLLEEFRTRLIADVVTGKLDVREPAAKLPNKAPGEETLGGDEVESAMGDSVLSGKHVDPTQEEINGG